jgi:tight adherence protein C
MIVMGVVESIKKYYEGVCEKYVSLYGKKRGSHEFRKAVNKAVVGYVASFILFPLTYVYGKSLFLSVVVFLVLIISFILLPNSLIESKMKDLRRSFSLNMPDFLERVAILLDSGQNLWASIEKAAMVNDDEFSLEGEISRTMKEINECRGSEKDPCDAFSDMAKRLESSHVSSFVSLIVQNSRKGQAELVEIIRMQAAIYRNDRKNVARKLGEEATTLMLIPTTIVFIGILIMLLSPAFLVIYSI